MIGAFLSAAAPILNPGAGNESPELKIAKLARVVSHRMREIENQSKERELTCISLYCHWILSLLVLCECVARLTIHLMVILIFFAGYYLVYCLSCGKANLGELKGHQLTRCSLYTGLMFAMFGNLITPWNPTFYMFHRPTTLSRPNIPRTNQVQDISALDIENFLVNDVLCCCCNCCGCRNGHCACCGQPAESILLPYKLAQISLFCVGFFSGCGMYQWTGGEPLHHRIEQALREIDQENDQATKQFYRQNYSCETFDELVRREITGGNSAPVYMQPPPQQSYGQQQQPVYAQAVPVQQAYPIARPKKFKS